MRPANIKADFVVYSRNFLRTRSALFFTILFPIIFLLVFGAIFSGGSTKVPLSIQNLNNGSAISLSFVSALNSTGLVTITSVPPNVNIQTYINQNSVDAALVIPANFAQEVTSSQNVNMSFYYNPSQSSAQAAEQAVNLVIQSFNFKIANATPIIHASVNPVSTAAVGYINYLIPGLIGFSVLTTGMFSMTNIVSSYKKEKIFRQLSLTPLTKGEWMVSKFMWNAIMAVVAIVLMISVGDLVFGAGITFNIYILPIVFFGVFGFISLGIVAGSISKNEETAAIIGNVITFPMMFLAGTFFPVSSMPTYLQEIAKFLPLYYVINGMNAIMLFGNVPNLLFNTGIVAAISLVFFFISMRVFSWRES